MRATCFFPTHPTALEMKELPSLRASGWLHIAERGLWRGVIFNSGILPVDRPKVTVHPLPPVEVAEE